jgi:hypothetical protein
VWCAYSPYVCECNKRAQTAMSVRLFFCTARVTCKNLINTGRKAYFYKGLTPFLQWCCHRVSCTRQPKTLPVHPASEYSADASKHERRRTVRFWCKKNTRCPVITQLGEWSTLSASGVFGHLRVFIADLGSLLVQRVGKCHMSGRAANDVRALLS